MFDNAPPPPPPPPQQNYYSKHKTLNEFVFGQNPPKSMKLHFAIKYVAFCTDLLQ